MKHHQTRKCLFIKNKSFLFVSMMNTDTMIVPLVVFVIQLQNTFVDCGHFKFVNNLKYYASHPTKVTFDSTIYLFTVF